MSEFPFRFDRICALLGSDIMCRDRRHALTGRLRGREVGPSVAPRDARGVVGTIDRPRPELAAPLRPAWRYRRTESDPAHVDGALAPLRAKAIAFPRDAPASEGQREHRSPFLNGALTPESRAGGRSADLRACRA